MNQTPLIKLALQGLEQLQQGDPQLYELLLQQSWYQNNTLAMIAAAGIADPSVLACEGSVMNNITTEGYPGQRFHAGSRVADEVEQIAIDRAKKLFHAEYANVQPHSGTSANECVLFSILQPGDTLLGMELDAGGHLSHGSQVSVSGRHFRAIGYSLNEDGFIDYEQVYKLAIEFKPKLIICGASAYPRVIDFQRFRQIADEVQAFLLADISHIAGLVVAGLHPSPINYAHITTTSTYKQLCGPRGGLILMGKDYLQELPEGKTTLASVIQRAVFPLFQGTPNLGSIAAKARAFEIATTPRFQALAQCILSDARVLATCLLNEGYSVLTGGTDNHMVIIDILARGLTGVVAEHALEECNIIVNKNRICGDTKPPAITSGLRLGTNILALRGMTEKEMPECAHLIYSVLSSTQMSDDRHYLLPQQVRESVLTSVQELCSRFPIPYHPD